jgi:hypothetical protein
MDLFFFTITTALLIGLLGVFFFLFRNKNNQLSTLLRSPKATILLLGISLFWFLYRHVQSLGDADFGEYKVTIGLIAVFIAVSSYFLINDFLAVRSICILLLFYAREVLDSAFLQEPTTRLFLVSVVYFMIVLSIYFGTYPYRLRDFLKWLYNKSNRPIFLGSTLVICSIILLWVSFTY